MLDHSPANPAGIDFSGEVALMPLTGDGQSYAMMYRLKNQNSGTSSLSTLHVRFALSPDFKLLSFQASEARTPAEKEELNVFKDLVSLFAFQSERDTTGELQQEIKEEDGLKSRRLIKLKRAYVSQGRRVANPRILSSWHQLTAGPDLRVDSILGKDELEFRFGNGLATVFDSSYRLQKLRGAEEEWARADLRLDSQKNSSQDAALRSPLLPADLRLEQVPDEIQSRSFSELKEATRGVMSLRPTERNRLFHDLIRYFRTSPAGLRSWLESVEVTLMDESDRARTEFSIGVLATESSPEAQAALIRALERDGASPNLQHLILNSLATSDATLSLQARDSLLRLTQSGLDEGIRENAILALGASLRTRSDDVIRSRIRELYDGAQSESEKVSVLEAMGNSGDPVFANLLWVALDSSSERIREKAAYAFRFMPSGESSVRSLALQRAGGDPSERVRQASLEALSMGTSR